MAPSSSYRKPDPAGFKYRPGPPLPSSSSAYPPRWMTPHDPKRIKLESSSSNKAPHAAAGGPPFPPVPNHRRVYTSSNQTADPAFLPPPPVNDAAGGHRMQIFMEATKHIATSRPTSRHPLPLNNNKTTTTNNRNVTPTPRKTTPATDPSYSRKTKSLGRLCEAFVEKFQSPSASTEICIDEVAKELGVERRRIYDIINIMESLYMVRRKCKNTYDWVGLEQLPDVFGRLQQEGMVEFSQDAVQFGLVQPEAAAVPSSVAATEESNREKKSLGKLSQQFLQLFLVGHPVMSLTEASDRILGTSSLTELAALGGTDTKKRPLVPPQDANLQAAASRGLKTKIRRLYDIANVFVGLDLITKLESDSRKSRPTFCWSYSMSPQDVLLRYKQQRHPGTTTVRLPEKEVTAAPPPVPVPSTKDAACGTPLPDKNLLEHIHSTGAKDVLSSIHQHGAADETTTTTMLRTVSVSPTDLPPTAPGDSE